MDRILKTIRLLVNNAPRQLDSLQPVLNSSTPSGIVYDLYEPVQACVATYLLVYGLDMAGEKDARLVRFAHACASVGLRAVVPDLTGLKSYRFCLEDLKTIADLTETLHQRYNAPIGMIGWSTGGSYALLVAATYQVGWIDPLLLFCPYYSLDGIPPIREPEEQGSLRTERDWDHYIWCQLVLAFQHLENSDFTQDERTELIDTLKEYCNLKPKHKLAAYQKLLKNRPPFDTKNNIFLGQDLKMFSLSGKLNHVKSRVYIFHDPDDYIIPPEHSKFILAELQQREKPAIQELLVTGMISHVTPQYSLHLIEGTQAIRMLGNLFPR